MQTELHRNLQLQKLQSGQHSKTQHLPKQKTIRCPVVRLHVWLAMSPVWACRGRAAPPAWAGCAHSSVCPCSLESLTLPLLTFPAPRPAHQDQGLWQVHLSLAPLQRQVLAEAGDVTQHHQRSGCSGHLQFLLHFLTPGSQCWKG